MAQDAKRKIAFISSFLPRKCGIATFTSDLIKNTAAAAEGAFEPLVVAMRTDDDIKYDDPVKFEIRQHVKNDYICAADYINFSHVDLVSVQHEFGLFGGDAGSHLSLLLNRLSAPIVTTLHTVLDDPAPDYYKSTIDVCNASHKIITMNKRGVTMLKEIYSIPESKILLVPHGIPDLAFVDNNYYKHKFGMEGRRTILTFGLISKNKGIEVMLQAMPAIVQAEPSALYIVLGMTHPSVLKHDGESYRFSLQQMVKELGIQDHVIFYNRFVNDEELSNFLCASDIYVTPYLSREQLTSGTLSFAVGAGKAVVSTPYWAAMELLANGQGKLVRFGDYKGTAQTIIEILKDDDLFYSLRRKAYEYGRSRTWPKVGEKYWKLFSSKRIPVAITTRVTAEPPRTLEVPEPRLDYIKKLTDDVGIYQHAVFTIPDRTHGYCTDDNVCALMAMTRYYSQYPEADALQLLDRYLSFVLYAQADDGTIRNFLNFDRTWRKDEPPSDAYGRALWALGAVIADPPSLSYLSVIKDCFDRSVEHVMKQSPRSMAYAILGMSDYLKQFPGASDIKRHLTAAADRLLDLYEDSSHPQWQWFEDILAYDNAILCHALFAAGAVLGEHYVKVAETTCEFLLENTLEVDHFSFVGCNGWYRRGGRKAAFDQQPIEAMGTILMLGDAYQATANTRYLTLQRKAFDWFLGENDLHIPIYNFKTKGCHDGLTAGGVNLNQGAESTLSFFLSVLTMIESYAASQNSRTAQSSAPRSEPQEAAEKFK